MTGIICMWHGLIVDIPDGWVLCDGTNGTPDMRERFVRGAADGIDPGGLGGSGSHSHIVAGSTGWWDDTHDHDYDAVTHVPQSGDADYVPVGGDFREYSEHAHVYDGTVDEAGENHRHTFFDVSSEKDSKPFYYDVVFIMKT